MNPFEDFFEKIYCINLEHRTDRWQECVSIFEKNYLSVERVCPVQVSEPKGILKKEQLSLLITHKNIIVQAKEKKLKNVLIFEDDIEFCDMVEEYKGKPLQERFSESICYLPSDWNVLMLGCGIYIDKKKHINKEMYKIEYGMTTHAISINSNYYDVIIKELNSQYDYLDNTYCNLMHKNNTYGFVPNLISQRVSYSDIEKKVVDYNSLRNFL